MLECACYDNSISALGFGGDVEWKCVRTSTDAASCWECTPFLEAIGIVTYEPVRGAAVGLIEAKVV